MTQQDDIIQRLRDLRLGVEMDRHNLDDGDAKLGALDAAIEVLSKLRAPVAGEAREHYDEVKATLQGAHCIMESLSAIERRVGPVGSHARGYTHKITNALRHLDALYAAPQASAEYVRKVHADAFIAGFICAGGDAEGAKRQAPQFQACIDAGRKQQPVVDSNAPQCPRCALPLRQDCNCDEGYVARAALDAQPGAQKEQS
jgi:hypothetical protein